LQSLKGELGELQLHPQKDTPASKTPGSIGPPPRAAMHSMNRNGQ